MGLLAGGESVADWFGQDFAVDIGCEADAGFLSGIEDGLGRESAEIGERFDVEGGDPFGVFGFAGGERFVRQGCFDDGAAAFADGFLEETLCGRRSHEGADGEGAGAFAKDSDVGGVATEVFDVGFDPLEGGDHIK